tara:strand:- start:50 stop:694 length:645 start_codon:yes stop_codon:yes gene_type:complete
MKRIAICFWGQTRTERGLDNCYKKLKSQNVQYDFFVSTWDDFESKNIFDFCVKKEFIKPDVLDFINHTDRASYLIHRVNSLKTQHELENNFIYDYVLWTRSEIQFEPNDLLKLFYSKLAHHETYELNVHSDDLKTDDDGNPYLNADYYFLGTSLSFDLYSTGWKQYYKCKNPHNGKHGGHNYHGWVIDNLPLKVVSVVPKHEFLCNKQKPKEVR